jgi:hypothetical protein
MAMIHINRDRESIGKFNDQDVADGLKSGRFLPTDLAWREPMESWQPLATFTDLPPPEQIETTNVETLIASTEASIGRISLSECFSNGWECFQRNIGVLMLGTFVFLVVNISLWFVSELAQKVVQMFLKSEGGEEQFLKVVAIGVGLFFSILTSTITTILSAGFLWMFIKNSRGKAEFADIFSGFSSGVWIQVLMAAVAWGAIMVGLAFCTMGPALLLSDRMGSQIPTAIGALLFLIPLIYLSIGLGFVFPLILDRHLGWKEAMRLAISTVHGQWLPAAGIIFIYSLLALSGLLVCCVGIFFTMPIGYCVWAEGYRRLFGDPTPEDKK